jgi:hypothetical protein
MSHPHGPAECDDCCPDIPTVGNDEAHLSVLLDHVNALGVDFVEFCWAARSDEGRAREDEYQPRNTYRSKLRRIVCRRSSQNPKRVCLIWAPSIYVSAAAVQRFTFGEGTTGLSREAYYAGWEIVGELIRSGMSFHDIATTPPSRRL